MFPDKLIILCFCLFFAVLFLQSGLDKVQDRAGNLKYFREFFGKSPLAPYTEFLLTALTVMEVGAGALSALGAISVWFVTLKSFPLPFYAMAVSALTMVGLFFGQRMAKDYQGAAAIVPYFIAAALGMFLMRGMAV